MILKVIFVFIAIVIVVTTLIIILNKHVFPIQNDPEEQLRVIQIDGGTARYETIMEYCLLRYTQLGIVIVHNPRPEVIRFANDKRPYAINIYNGRRKLVSGYVCFERNAHTIFISKRHFLITEEISYVLRDDVNITKLHITNQNFLHIQTCVIVCTVTRSDNSFAQTPETDALVVRSFAFILEQCIDKNMPFVIIGNFATMWWDEIRKHFIPDTTCLSSGQYRICTYRNGRKLAAPHGLIMSKNMSAKVSVGTPNIEPACIGDNDLMFCATLSRNNKNIMNIDEQTQKIAAASTAYASDDNYLNHKHIACAVDNTADNGVFEINRSPSERVKYTSIEAILQKIVSGL